MMSNRARCALAASLLFAAAQSLAAVPGYFRMPSLRGETLAFVAEGDIWTVAAGGGRAIRVTSAQGQELFPVISPDGRRIAFCANYDGPREIYVMPIEGGLPRRVSFDGGNPQTVGWTARGEVLYNHTRDFGPNGTRIVSAVDPESLARRDFPVAEATEATLDASGHWLYFVHNGLQLTGDHARGYRGGAMAQLWRLDLTRDVEAEQLATAMVASKRQPMLWQDRLYFLADSGGSYNLWSSDLSGEDRREETHARDWDVREASIDGGRVAYRLGADIHVLDLATRADRTVAIDLTSDFDQARRRWIRQPLESFESARFSPSGERVAVVARGRAVVAGVGPQRRVEVASGMTTRVRDAVESSDGHWVYAISDASGEDEIWQFAANGSTQAPETGAHGAEGASGSRQLSHNAGHSRLAHLYPSPDGRWIAFDDDSGRLAILAIADGHQSILVEKSTGGDSNYDEVHWSPDSRVIATLRSERISSRQQLVLHSVDGHSHVVATDDRYNTVSAGFSPDNHWLYYIAQREFVAEPGAPWGDRNTGPFFDKRGRIYALALQKGEHFPFREPTELDLHHDDQGKPEKPAHDDATGRAPAGGGSETMAGAGPAESVDPAAKGAGKEAGHDDAHPKKLAPIDLDGLTDRLYQVPLEAGNYSSLAVDAKRLYFLDKAAGREQHASLKTLAIENTEPKPAVFSADIAQYALSADGKKLFYRRAVAKGAGDMYIVEAAASPPKDLSKSTVRLADWALVVDPRAEWHDEFVDAWRMHRDFFYDPAMRGLDWRAVRAKYEPLTERVTERSELDDVLGMMIGELGAMHSQVGGADLRRALDGAPAAFLGATVRIDGQRVVLEHIYQTEADLPDTRGPLQAPDIRIHEGDVLQDVNGLALHSEADLANALVNQAGQQVLLRWSDAHQGAHKAVVVPVDTRRNAQLRYGDWERRTEARVLEASHGRIGYLHLRAMQGDDIDQFVREFYANIGRDGLVIDVRDNNGGNVDSWIIEKLLRRVWMYWTDRHTPVPELNMQQTFRGHLVVLVNAYTYSDGETFSNGIKTLGIAPLIGQRTAGAGVWLSDNNRLADHGIARAAESPQFSLSGEWQVEGVGVAPDYAVDNPPRDTFNGGDAQLRYAIDFLEKLIAREPIAPLKTDAPLRRP